MLVASTFNDTILMKLIYTATTTTTTTTTTAITNQLTNVNELLSKLELVILPL